MSILTRRNVDFDTFIIVKTGLVTVTKPASTSSYTEIIPHGLSFIPMIIAFAESSDIYQMTPIITLFSTGAISLLSEVQIDATNIYIIVQAPNTGANPNYTAEITENYRYYLLQDRAS